MSQKIIHLILPITHNIPYIFVIHDLNHFYKTERQ